MSTNTISQKIKEARREARLSQKQLSEALLVSEKAISSYEAGRTIPSVKTLQRIAIKTNKPISYFTEESADLNVTITELLKSIDSQLAQIRQLLDIK